MVEDSSNSSRERSATRAGSQSAVRTTPGRLRFMMTGVSQASSAPASSRRSSKGS